MLLTKNAIGNNWEVDKRAVSTRLTPSQLQDCHHFLLVEGGDDNQEIAAHLGNKSQKLYYDGVLINYIEEFGSITNNLPFGVTVNNHKPNVFPLNIGSNPNRGGINTAFSGKIQEIRVWRRDENGFNASNITSYRNSSLPFSQQYNTNLLAYWKLDDYTQENGRLKFKDYSIHNKDIEVALYTISPPAPVLPIGRRLYVSNTTTECITHERPTVTKFLHTCQDAYTFGDGVDLWGGRPLTPPTAEELQADCERITTDLLGDYTERLLVKQKEALEAKAEEEYRNQCFSSPFKETFTLKYAKKEYHYTLYYYDQAGNLVQTVPPEGVVLDGTGQNHKLQTKYAYNTLGQVVWQQTPDAGESKFWIDYYGRVKLSQNAEQKEHSDYAYSKFDELGRPYEVGKLSSSGNLRLEVEGNNPLTLLDKSELIFDSDFPRAGSVTLLQVNGGTPTFNFTLSERTKTFYDKHDATGIVDPIEQKNLKNRVAAVVVMEAVKTSETQPDELGAITRYSYDIHGNVEKLWQKLPQETGVPEKTVEYNYDLLSGKVNEVVYEGGKTDEFRHRYLYDGDNRLTQVETSLDGYHWTLEASYFYYAHGPLARIETGQHNIQGTDYFYTLQGWIKGVNSIGLTHTRQDPGRDGYTGYTEEEAQNPTFNRDEYAYALNYYEGDYEARGENHLLGKAFHANEIYSNFKNYEDKVGGVTYNRESLYNGNIAAMATSIRHFGELKSTQSMNYRYDQLHRIAAAHASKWEGIWTTTEGSYNTSYAYDGNGNIQNLYRNNLEATTIDELYYHYDPVKKNRLDVVKDGGTAEGLNNANPYEYKYDQIGNLTQNLEDGIEDIEWNIYGKVEKVSKTNGTLIAYRYDGTGNRILKEVRTTTTVHTNLYLRDASGNVMAIYEDTRPINTNSNDNIAIKEIPIYGSSRLGQYRPKAATKPTALGQRIYEFSNHLGNVLVTLSDNKVPQTDGTYKSVVVSASDYYPFGMAMKERTYQNSEYRYGFNGQEQSDELDEDGNSYTAEFWQYSAVIGRRWNVDPITLYSESGYAALRNDPILYIDGKGNHPIVAFFIIFALYYMSPTPALAPTGNVESDNRALKEARDLQGQFVLTGTMAGGGVLAIKTAAGLNFVGQIISQNIAFSSDPTTKEQNKDFFSMDRFNYVASKIDYADIVIRLLPTSRLGGDTWAPWLINAASAEIDFTFDGGFKLGFYNKDGLYVAADWLVGAVPTAGQKFKIPDAANDAIKRGIPVFLRILTGAAPSGKRVVKQGIVEPYLEQQATVSTFSSHKVKKGDTIYAISRKYKIDKEKIFKANPNFKVFTDENGDRNIKIKPDQELIIPYE